VEICRTPGFWCTHECGGTDDLGAADEPPTLCEGKKNAQNITLQVIDAADGINGNGEGSLQICGKTIDNTVCGSTESALEALCVSNNVKDGNLQLARQLTAAALNCIMSGGGSNCSGTSIENLFAECNALCTGTPDNALTVTSCIEEIDCFNNGGTFDAVTQVCQAGEPGNNCHDRLLCNENILLCFDETGPAGSSKANNKAIKNDCTIFAPAADCNGCTAD
jgi:hypothetical protein